MFTPYRDCSINSVIFSVFNAEKVKNTVMAITKQMKGVDYRSCPLCGEKKKKSHHFIFCGEQWLLHPRVVDNHVSLSGMREA